MSDDFDAAIVQERAIRGTTRSTHICDEGPAYQSVGAHPKYVAKVSESALSYGQDEIEVRVFGCVTIPLAGYPVEASAVEPIQHFPDLQSEFPRLAAVCECGADC